MNYYFNELMLHKHLFFVLIAIPCFHISAESLGKKYTIQLARLVKTQELSNSFSPIF